MFLLWKYDQHWGKVGDFAVNFKMNAASEAKKKWEIWFSDKGEILLSLQRKVIVGELGQRLPPTERSPHFFQHETLFGAAFAVWLQLYLLQKEIFVFLAELASYFNNSSCVKIIKRSILEFCNIHCCRMEYTTMAKRFIYKETVQCALSFLPSSSFG